MQPCNAFAACMLLLFTDVSVVNINVNKTSTTVLKSGRVGGIQKYLFICVRAQSCRAALLHLCTISCAKIKKISNSFAPTLSPFAGRC